MYEYSPKPNRTRATVLASLTLAIGLGSFGLSSSGHLPFPALWQLLGLTLICLSILTATRYLLKTYRYGVVLAHDGQYDLTVTECQGKRRDVVCRLLMTSLLDYLPYDKKTKAQYRGQKIHNYCIDLLPDDAYLLFFADTDKDGDPTTLLILLSPDDKLLSLFAQYRPAKEGS